MTREEHKKAIIENLNAMVDKLEDDTEYFDALYHLDMLCKETEPKFIAKSDGTIEQIKNCDDCVFRKEWEKIGKLILSVVLEKQTEQEPKWIPIKTRPLTNKEKEEYAYLGFSEDSIDFMYDCSLPEDGEEVLITTRYDEVRTDTFYRDDGCYFETYCDEDDVKAWMPLPKPYKAESEE